MREATPTPRRRAGRATAQERPRGGYARAVAEMVPAIGGAAFRRFGFVQASVVSRWGEIVGERYAGVSAPESIRFPAGQRAGGTLSLTVEGAHATMIQHVAPSIIERVNRFFGYEAVVRLAIRQGAVGGRRRAVPPPTPAPVPEALGDSLKPIADPELRAVLESLARGLAAPPPVSLPILGKIR